MSNNNFYLYTSGVVSSNDTPYIPSGRRINSRKTLISSYGSGGGTGRSVSSYASTSYVPVIHEIHCTLLSDGRVYVSVDSSYCSNFTYSFGDGGSRETTQDSIVYQYKRNGKYTVKVFATDYSGNKSNAVSKTIEVETRLPFSVFVHTSQGLTVYVKDVSNVITSNYEWDFGDGTGKYYGKEIIHTYSKQGNYTIIHTAGNYSPDIRTITLPETSAKCGTGSGTLEDPFIICTAQQLQAMHLHLDWFYKLGQDIDATETRYWSGPNGFQGFQPIGYLETDAPGAPFTGGFDGDNHIIKNLFIHSLGDSTGLFGYAQSFYEIKNVGLENVDITGRESAGALIGYGEYGTISNCYSTGAIKAMPTTYSSYSLGGLIGGMDTVNVDKSYSTVNLTGFFGNSSDYNSIGGLIGTCILASSPTASIHITNCYASGNIGLSGNNPDNNPDADINLGGLIGWAVSEGGSCTFTMYNSYSAGQVETYTGTYIHCGGLIANSSGFGNGNINITNSYWDTEVSGQASSAGGTGKTTDEMQQQSTFVDWDFNNIWKMNGYPELRNMPAETAPITTLLNADFDFTPTTGFAPIEISFDDKSSGNPTSWLWDFGDRATSVDQNPTHTYQKAGIYRVKLTASNGIMTDSVIRYITIEKEIPIPNIPPIADFTTSSLIGKAPLTVVFTDNSSGVIANYLWDFGDGTTSTEENPQHTYTKQGNYTVTLTVEDNNGLTSSSSVTIVVLAHGNVVIEASPFEIATKINYILSVGGITSIDAEPFEIKTSMPAKVWTSHLSFSDYPPVANIHADKMAGFKPLTVQFSADVSTPDVFYEWDFGDGTTSDKKSPKHTFSTADKHTVTLTVRNAYGETTSSMMVFVAGWIGKYNLALPNHNYFYLIDRAGNMVYIYNYDTTAFVSKFGGKGTDFGKFNMPTTLTIGKPIF